MALLYSLCLLFPQHYPEMSVHQRDTVCKYEHLIRVEAKKNDLKPELLASLIFVESAFRPSVQSSVGACGLTQVVPKWTGGKETGGIKYTCRELKRPETSIRVGAQILSYNIGVYAKGNVDKGLCMYNAGTMSCKRSPCPWPPRRLPARVRFQPRGGLLKSGQVPSGTCSFYVADRCRKGLIRLRPR